MEKRHLTLFNTRHEIQVAVEGGWLSPALAFPEEDFLGFASAVATLGVGF